MRRKGLESKRPSALRMASFYTTAGKETAGILVLGACFDPELQTQSCHPALPVMGLHSPTSTETVFRWTRS